MITQQHRLRITLVIPSLQCGGAERVASLLAAAFPERGHSVTVITLDRNCDDFFTLPPAVARFSLDQTVDSRRNPVLAVHANLARIRALRESLVASRPDVVVSFGVMTNVLTILAATGMSVPVVIREESDPRHALLVKPWPLLRRATYRRAAALMVLTDELRSWANEMIDPARVCVVPNPVVQLEGSASIDSAVIVALGRLVDVKGFDLLLHSFSRCCQHFPEWQLRIGGDGPLLRELEGLRDVLGLNRQVTFAGRVSDPAAFLKQGSIFALSSKREGFSLALVEAMSLGLPAVSFDCPSGPRHIISHDRDGLLVPPGNVEQLSRSMNQLMSDRQLRLRLGTAARSVTTRFSVGLIASQWERIFRDAMRTGGRSTVASELVA